MLPDRIDTDAVAESDADCRPEHQLVAEKTDEVWQQARPLVCDAFVPSAVVRWWGNPSVTDLPEACRGAMIERQIHQDEFPEWGESSSAGRELRLEELELERRVSDYLRDFPFSGWRSTTGAESDRAVLERNTIALASNFGKPPVDP